MDIVTNYEESGAGEPLILLHGNGESHRYFKNQIGFFVPRFRVIAVDTRGHGGSPRGEGPFTLGRFAEDLKGFMEEHEIAKADILGFSDGGNIALLFALKYPHMVNKLILNGANLDPKGVKASFQIPICIIYGLLSIAAPFSGRAKAKKELYSLMVNEPDIKATELAALKMPVLVVAGKNDMIKESHTREIASAIRGAELCIIEGDHYIARRKSAEFNKRVSEFLG